jgi:hypothetical protein
MGVTKSEFVERAIRLQVATKSCTPFQNSNMKRLILLLLLAIPTLAFPQSFRLYHGYGNTAWIDQSILTDAIETGKAAALKWMRQAVERANKEGNIYVHWNEFEKWTITHGGRYCTGVAAKAWSDTCWNTLIQTVAEHSDWIKWYNSFPHHAKLVIDTSGF